MANWEIVKSDAGLSLSIVADRLRIDNDAIKASVTASRVTLRKSAAYSRGHLFGRIRTKFEVTDQIMQLTEEGFFGLFCMMSQTDITSTTGAAYGFGLHPTDPIDAAIMEWRLYKFTEGARMHAGGSISYLLATANNTLSPAPDTNYTMQLEWAYHTLIGGTRLLCKAGLAENNFEDLVTIYDYTDSSTPLTTSVGEGILWEDAEGTALKRCYYDDTTIIQLAATPLPT